MYRYYLIPEAAREFDREIAYSEKHWGKKHAKNYVRALKTALSTICNNPFALPERTDILPGIRIATHKGNRIIYTVIEAKKQVVVIGVLSIYQDVLPQKLQKRIPVQ